MAGMNWNWFGWFGLFSLCLFWSFMLFPHETDSLPQKVGSIGLLFVMFSSTVFPLVAVRSSKWWLLLVLCGMVSVVRFFWILSY
jgi:hypothetical protein